MQLCIYLAILLIFPILGVLSRGEAVTAAESEPVSAVQVPFQKISLYLYRRQKGSRLHGLLSRLPGESTVRADLWTIDPSPGKENTEARFFVRKLRWLLIFLFLADLLAILFCLSAGQGDSLSADGTIERKGYGEADTEILLSASADGQELGEYEVNVSSRKYTEKELDTLSERAFEELSGKLPGENTSLSAVSHDLFMPAALEGYPFHISWESSRYALIDADGSVYTGDLQQGEKAEVELTAVATAQDRRYSRSFSVTVTPPPLSAEEKLQREILSALFEADTKGADNSSYRLPTEVAGRKLSWSEPKQENSSLLFCLVLLAGLANYALADRELHMRIEKSRRQMQLDYPQVLSRIILFVGAGLSVRSSFRKIADDYRRDLERGEKKRSIYEEILLMSRELSSGVSEADCYAHFARRCGSLSYSRFCSLLTQNLRKGNSALLAVLQTEAAEAFEERRNLARRMGEEAGTKLLFPMILMLLVTMIIIMIPAYQSFSM
ncbi:MAG: type II secretion system F family protein [Lachnospiraceae bacterium]|jgi:tight adherence protein C|nr:type II secretion system F family protein [Lachnospiraceae bacterium]